MSYEKIRFLLDRKYKTISLNNDKSKKYYVNKEGKIVATVSANLIVLYIDDKLDNEETQYQKLVRVIPQNPTIKPARLKLIGMYNDATIEDGNIQLAYDAELDRMCEEINPEKMSQQNLGSVYNIDEDNKEIKTGKITLSSPQNRIASHQALTKKLKCGTI